MKRERVDMSLILASQLNFSREQ
jgi:hypothetical protein